MITIYCDKNLSFSDLQMKAVNSFHELRKEKNPGVKFSDSFNTWLSKGYAEKFRHLFVLENQQSN